MTLEQATERRLQEIRELVRSGVTEHTGRAMRTAQEEGGEATGRRFRGLKPSYPELLKIADTPGAIATAVEKGSGPVYKRVQRAVSDAMYAKGYEPARRRSAGRPTVPGHPGAAYCKHCREFHTKGQHRFHGSGSFHRTHLFSFKDNREEKCPRCGAKLTSYEMAHHLHWHAQQDKKAKPKGNPMTVQRARQVFADLMKLSRERSLTDKEGEVLRRASQLIRYARRTTAARNPRNVGRKNPHVRFFRSRAQAEKHRRALMRKGVYSDVHQDIRGFVLTTPTGKELREHKERQRHAIKRLRLKPNPVGLVRMGKLVELRYYRDHGTQPGYYKHPFKSRPTIYYDRRRNTIIIR